MAKSYPGEYIVDHALLSDRQFLIDLKAEWGHNEDAFCLTRVTLAHWLYGDEVGEMEIESRLQINDGYHGVEFSNMGEAQTEDEHLASITKLMEMVIAYRQAYAEALAVKRGQSVSQGADITLTLNLDGSKTT